MQRGLSTFDGRMGGEGARGGEVGVDIFLPRQNEPLVPMRRPISHVSIGLRTGFYRSRRSCHLIEISTVKENPFNRIRMYLYTYG